MPSNHLILCLPLLLLPSISSIIKVFIISWFFTTGGHWSFSFSISLSNECSGLIFFRTDWFDLLAVQGIFKSLHQHQSSKISILQHSAFFMIQLSQLQYVTTGKTIALTVWNIVSKVMSLLSGTLSMFVMAFLPRSKCLLISWPQSPSMVILEPRKNFPLYWSLGEDG